jgi:hypothetical protein
MGLLQQTQAIDWANQTNLHWLGLSLTLALGYGTWVLPRRWVPLMLLTLACFIPPGQRLVWLTLDFTFLRLLVLCAWLRVVVRREWTPFRWHALDVVLLAWAAVALAAHSLQQGTSEALIYKLGLTFDGVGLYFLSRCLVRDWEDVRRVAHNLTFLALPVCLAFVIERSTGRNLFSAFGGVPEFTEVRDGRLRCQGAFAHSILAGCFWAAAWPLMAAQWWAGGRGRRHAVLGSLCALTMIFLTASSTPVLAALCVVLGGACFLLRRFMGVGRLGLLVGVVTLHFVMKAPVWHLLGRVNVVGGSTGWHRFYLVDQTIKHFGEWWLLGTPSTAHWGRGLSDLTNQYVIEATQGGLLQLLLFVALIVLGFRAAGRAWRAAWPRRADVALSWALGVSLFTQSVAFIGVGYFGQEWILWFMALAGLASLSGAQPERVPDPARELRARAGGRSPRPSDALPVTGARAPFAAGPSGN